MFRDNGSFVTLQEIVENTELFRFAAEAQGSLAAPHLWKLLSGSTIAERLAIGDQKRRDLFHTCEEFLFLEETSEEGLRCLALLAEAENESWSNNCTGVFKEAFGPMHPQVPLILARRFAVLREFLTPGQSNTTALLALEATGGASESYAIMLRHSGRVRPLGRTPEMTWQDVWAYLEDCLDLVAAATGDIRADVRACAGNLLPRAITNLIVHGHNERAWVHVPAMIERAIAGDPIFNANRIADRLSWCRLSSAMPKSIGRCRSNNGATRSPRGRRLPGADATACRGMVA